MKTTLFLADDHAIVRDGLKAALSFIPDFEVVGEAAEGRETFRKVLELKPAVVLMDIAMPGLDGIGVTQLLKSAGSISRVLILSMHSTAEHIFQAFESGVQGSMLKGSSTAELVAAIHKIAGGIPFLDPGIPPSVLAVYEELRKAGRKNPLMRLTPREREVMNLVITGDSSHLIGQKLSLSVSSVDTYRSRLMLKLGVGNAAELIKFAVKNKLVPFD
jgi:DNA-binding NarL/FixJ family response regulator